MVFFLNKSKTLLSDLYGQMIFCSHHMPGRKSSVLELRSTLCTKQLDFVLKLENYVFESLISSPDKEVTLTDINQECTERTLV